VSRVAAAGARAIGLDKPTSLARVAVDKINPYSDIANARGIDCSAKLAVDPENAITTKPCVGGITTDEMDISYIAGTPTLMSSMTFGLSDAIGLTKLVASNNINLNSWTYASWLCDLTKSHSGSIKVKVYISASTLHSCRLVFFLNTTNNYWQDCYHRVVDVQGDTEVDILLPYTVSNIASKNWNATSTLNLYVMLLSYSQPQGSVNTPIYLNSYGAAASDFRIFGPKDRFFSIPNGPAALRAEATDMDYEPESNPRLDFCSDFQPIHPSITGYEHSGLIYGEEIKNYRDFVHRYCPIRLQTGDTYFSTYEGHGNIGTNGFAGLEMYGLIFRFWRGSIRFKIIQPDSKIRAVEHADTVSTHVFSGTTLSSTVNPLLEFEAPFYYDRLFHETGDDSTNVIRFSGTSDAYLLKAGGDDFSFHFLVPPPIYDYPFSTNYGLEGLMSWLTTTVP